MSNSLDPDQDQQKNVGPDLDPTCLQSLSAEVTASKERTVPLKTRYIHEEKHVLRLLILEQSDLGLHCRRGF